LALERLSWKQTFSRIRADYRRLISLHETLRGRQPVAAALHPSFIAVFLYRVSTHFFRAGHPYIARFWWHMNHQLTGADIPEQADFGEGLVLVNPAGMSIMGKSGRNLTLMPLSGIGSELGRREDVGFGPGHPVLGDDVVLEPFCGVLGPVRIGDRVTIRAATAVVRDVPDDTVIGVPEPKVLSRRDLP
jgi:serine O-acetyltransferase